MQQKSRELQTFWLIQNFGVFPGRGILVLPSPLFYRDSGVSTSANAICQQWAVRLVQPIASNRAERCNYALLTTK